MELFLWTGTIVSITAHHVMWSAEPSAKQLENEKYWESQTKLWESQRKRDLVDSISVER